MLLKQIKDAPKGPEDVQCITYQRQRKLEPPSTKTDGKWSFLQTPVLGKRLPLLKKAKSHLFGRMDSL